MVGKTAISLAFAAMLAAAPALAQEASQSGSARETCLKVSLDGDYKFRLPCPPGIRPLLKRLPRPAEPAPRRDIVIDPEWPRDQAMATEHDWPHDYAMIAPQADDGEEEAIPLFEDLRGLFERNLSGHSARPWPPARNVITIIRNVPSRSIRLKPEVQE